MRKTRSWNRFLSLALCLCMVLSMIPGIPLSASAAGASGSYVLVTDINQILAGGQFVIVANSDGTPLALSTTISGKIDAVAVTVENNAVSGDSLPVWTVEPTAGGVALSANGSYLGYKSSTNFAASTEAYEWGVAAGNNGFILDSTSTTRGIYYQISSSRFGAYAQSNADNGSYIASLQLYQYQDAGSDCSHSYVNGVCTSCGKENLISIYFQNNWLWSDVKLHYWGSSFGTTYPGIAMELYGNDGTYDIYVAKVPCDITGLLINGIKNDGSGSMDQTPDITGGWFDGVLYSMTWSDGNAVNADSITNIEITPPACQHNAQVIPGTAATCTTDGLTDGSKCSLCGETLTAQETIPASGHNYSNGFCTICGATDAANSRYIQVTNIADILSGGQFVIVANNGGTALALDTLTSGRITPVTVTLNGAIVTGDSLPVWTVETSGSGIALKSGDKYLSCKSNTSFSSSDTAHEWSVTAGDTGFFLNSASVNRGIYYQFSGNCFGAYSTSNATNTGYISQLQLYKCRVVTGSCSHSYGEQITTAPTCITQGVKTMICSLCGDSYTQTIATVGHTEETVPGKASTCTTPGLSDGAKCSVCGEVLTPQEPLPTAAHSFENGACTVCGAASHMTIYFQSNWNWTNINLYFWGSNTEACAEWPGNAMEYYGYDGTYEIYVLEVPTDITGMIFNGTADDGNAAQTVDITGGWSDNALFSLVWNDGNHVNVGKISDIGLSCNHKAETIPGYAATCTTDGLTEGSKCTLCGEILTVQETIPAAGHNYVNGYCSACGQVNPENCRYVLVTDIADILSGGQFVIVANNDGAAQALNTLISGKIDPVTVTVENNVATGDDLPVWTIASTENGIALSVDGVYLGYTSGTNFVSAGTAYEWGVKAGDNYGFIFNSTSSTRGIYYQISGNRFGAYSSNNEANTGYISQLQLYKCRIATGECAHSYSEKITTAPTCTTEGVKTLTCGLCGHSYTETVSAAGHSFENGACTVCGTASHMTIYFQSNWNWTNVNLYFWGSNTEACAEWPGNAMEYYGYDGTYDIYVLEVPTDIAGMIFNGTADDGNAAQTVDITGGWSDNALYSLVWNEGNHVNAGNISDVTISCKHEAEALPGYAATCTTDGLTDGSKCSLCGEILTAQESIPALGHTEKTVPGYAATCTENGLSDGALCTVCGITTTEQKTLPAAGHSFENGKCSVCGSNDPASLGYVLVTDISEILSGGQFIIVATTADGTQALDATISSKIPAASVTVENNIVIGSNLPVWTIEPTGAGVALSVNGTYLGYLSGTNFASSETAYEWSVAAGSGFGFTFTSSDRGVFYQISYNRFGPYSTTNAANSGYISQLQLYKSKFIPTNCTHSYTAQITTAPNCNDSGIKTFICSLCGNGYTETIPAYGHAAQVIPGYAASCTKDGLTDGSKCSTCGEILAPQKTIPATKHSAQIIPGYAATCTEDGLTDGSKCSTCGEILTPQKTIPATKHSAQIIPGYAATCTKDGLTDGSKCSTCGETLTVQETIPALGHKFENGACTVCGTVSHMTIYFQSNWNWTNVNLYFWGSNTEACAEWPGNAMEYYGYDGTYDIYVLEVPTDITGMIFNGTADDGNAAQTVDITGGWSDDALYSLVWNEGNHVNVGNISDITISCKHEAETISGYAATCTTDGLTDGSKCSLCGEILTAQESIPAFGHTAKTVPGYAASCTKDGLTDGSKCSTCGETLTVQETIPALGHDFENGACTVCGTVSHMTIYFQSNWNWTNVHLYFWGSNTEACAEWPGNAMEYYGYDGTYDIYVLEVPTDITGMIFNGTADDGNAAQTVDITGGWSDDALYSLVWNEGNCVNTGKISDIELAPSAPAQELKFSGATLTLNDDLTIKFKADQALIEDNGYTNVYAVFVLGDRTTVVQDYTIENGKYVFAFRNIAPYRMLDAVSATLYGTYNGAEYTSQAVQYSVADYCYNMLSKYSSDTYAEFRTLLVDLLNYGEASQKYVGYNTDALVTANLTATQKAWGTASNRTWKSVQDLEYAAITSPIVQWKGGGLVLKEAISMRFKISAANIEGLSVKVTESSGTETIITTFEATDGGYYFYFNGLNAAQMSESVYLTVYKNGVAVSNTIRYSIESYAYAQQNNSSATLVTLLKAMMKYGDAAKAYVS